MALIFNTYKVLKGFYSEKKEIEIVLPEGIKLVYLDGAIGSHGCYIGHNHYIGFIRNKDYPKNIRKQIDDKNRWVYTKPFDDLTLIYMDDIKPIDNLPVYSSKEMMEEFSLRDYFIICEKKPIINEEVYDRLFNKCNGDINEIVQLICDIKTNNIEGNIELFTPGKVYAIYKIQDIFGPYDCKVFEVCVGNYFNDSQPHPPKGGCLS